MVDFLPTQTQAHYQLITLQGKRNIVHADFYLAQIQAHYRQQHYRANVI